MPLNPTTPSRRKQCGAAMLVLITLFTLLGAYLIATRLSRTSVEMAVDRDQRTQRALQEARAALIAYAANPALTQIGALPCPDRKLPSDSTTGAEESSCDTDAVRIGRLPWKTINVSSDLRDGSGEPLWYVLSGNFRKKSGTTVINSDTQGQITLTGAAPASSVVALIIAPGISLGTQNRDKTDLSALNDPSNYFEGTNAGANDNSFETRAPPNDKDTDGGLVFNDRMLAITHADLFAVVEPVIAYRLRNDTGTNYVKSLIEAYRTTWGRYPYPAAFANPGSTDFKGTVGTSEGLLPLTSDAAFITWKTSGPAPSIAKSGGTGTVTNTNCTASTTSQLDCQFDYGSGRPQVTLTATAENVGRAFVTGFSMSDLTIERTSGSPNTCAPLCSWAGRSTTSISSSTSISASSYTLATDASGPVSLTLLLPSRSSTRTIRLRVPIPPYSTLTSSTDPDTGWMLKNEWQKQVYYAVASDYLPGGSGSCTAGSTCLTVNNLPSAEYPTTNDKIAILILMGRSLNGSSRPSATLSDYLEGQNASTGDGVFEHRVGVPGSINDRVVVLAP